MPHVIIKMFPGRSEEQKQALTDEVVKNIVSIADCSESTVSVAIEEIAPDDWDNEVFEPDIQGNKEKLYKKPGYKALE